MPKASSRPSFPTSSTDFALPPSSSSPIASTSAITLDDPNLLLQRFRRPSLLASKASYLSESRLHSPLASSFTMHSRRRSQSMKFVEDSESDKERMFTDSSSGSSENPTPPLKPFDTRDDDFRGKTALPKPPSTPPRRTSSANEVQDAFSPMPARRLSFPLKQPRILNLLAEARPEENEVRSEAAFQRLIAELPIQPRTPRVITDRGRYPEEAGEEEPHREDTPSDDDNEPDETPFAFSAPSGSEPIAIKNPRRPAGGANGDDLTMSISESSSFGTVAMDIDIPLGSPSASMTSQASTPINHWRYTPPPTTSAVRSNKRKLDDRFDPYASASKRRAVSPSVAYLRDTHPTIGSPINPRNNRLPISIPINIPGSAVSSATSSPTIGASYPASFQRSVSITSSPTLRSSMILASPILRPVPRHGMGKRGEEEEREIEGAGEAVGGLTLG